AIHQAATSRMPWLLLSSSGITMSTQETQNRCSARSSSALMASGDPDAMARWTDCGLAPRPATAGAAAASEMPRNVTTASFIVLFMCMSPLRGRRAGAVEVLAEEELTTHVDVQDEEVHLVRRQLRITLGGGVADRSVHRREGANAVVDRREALHRVHHLHDEAVHRRARLHVLLGRRRDVRDVRVAEDLAQSHQGEVRRGEVTRRALADRHVDLLAAEVEHERLHGARGVVDDGVAGVRRALDAVVAAGALRGEQRLGLPAPREA